jgi:hypothetical protein
MEALAMDMHMEMPIRPLYLWVVIAILIVVPTWRILRRVGFSGWWSVFAVVPVLNVILLYVVAFAPWPQERSASGTERRAPIT